MTKRRASRTENAPNREHHGLGLTLAGVVLLATSAIIQPATSSATVSALPLDRVSLSLAARHWAAVPIPCLCTANLYNCADFPTQAEAQACFDRCRSLGKEDVHHLDAAGDGAACEELVEPVGMVGDVKTKSHEVEARK